MSRVSHLSLYEPMTKFLETQISSGFFRPGERLPPLREWCEKFQINLDTARRGMWYLRDRGIVECRHGSGIYVRDFGEKSVAERRIAVLLDNPDPSLTYCAHAMLGIRQRAEEEKECALQLLPESLRFNQPDRNSDLLEEWIAPCESIILLGSYEAYTLDFSWLRKPAVGVEMHGMYNGLFSTLSMDPVNAAELAAAYFLDHGKRHIRVIGHPSPLQRFRANVFMAHFAELGGRAEYCETKFSAPELSLVDDKSPGYLFTGGSCFQEFAEHWPGDLAHDRLVVSLDAKSEYCRGYYPVTNIGPDWRQVGILAFEEALRRGDTPGSAAHRIYVDVKLTEQ